MGSPVHYLVPNESNTAFIGAGFSPDGTLPPGAVPVPEAISHPVDQYVPNGSGGYTNAPASVLLEQAQSVQIAFLKSGYQTAINAPVTFKNAAGITSTYPSGNTILITGDKAKTLLAETIAAGASAWTLGKWLDTNDVAQTFTFADLQGLASAMEAAVTVDYETLVSKIAEVNAATTISEVQAVTW